jgi:hypothetical protein
MDILGAVQLSVFLAQHGEFTDVTSAGAELLKLAKPIVGDPAVVADPRKAFAKIPALVKDGSYDEFVSVYVKLTKAIGVVLADKDEGQKFINLIASFLPAGK